MFVNTIFLIKCIKVLHVIWRWLIRVNYTVRCSLSKYTCILKIVRILIRPEVMTAIMQQPYIYDLHIGICKVVFFYSCNSVRPAFLVEEAISANEAEERPVIFIPFIQTNLIPPLFIVLRFKRIRSALLKHSFNT